MRAGDLRRRLADWPAAVTDGLGPALDAAAENVAAEARRKLATGGVSDQAGRDMADAIVTGRDAEGRATISVTGPGAVAREYGRWHEAARPFLRPALALTRDTIRDRIAGAVRHALSVRNVR